MHSKLKQLFMSFPCRWMCFFPASMWWSLSLDKHFSHHYIDKRQILKSFCRRICFCSLSPPTIVEWNALYCQIYKWWCTCTCWQAEDYVCNRHRQYLLVLHPVFSLSYRQRVKTSLIAFFSLSSLGHFFQHHLLWSLWYLSYGEHSENNEFAGFKLRNRCWCVKWWWCVCVAVKWSMFLWEEAGQATKVT